MELNLMRDYIPELITDGNSVGFWEISGEIQSERNLPPFSQHVLLLVIKGEVKVTYRGKEYHLRANTMADAVGDKFCLSINEASENCHAVLLCMEDMILKELFRERAPFNTNYVMRTIQELTSSIPANKIKRIVKAFKQVKDSIEDKDNYFYKQLINQYVMILLFQYGNVLIPQEPNHEITYEKRYKELIFQQFTDLVQKNIDKEHETGYYAKQLCISAEYLRQISKSCSGKNPSSYIHEHLIRRICRLLAETNLSIAQIADKLNFSSQAVLTKFFKRYKGKTPVEYRNSR